jgi:hypothetical protein
VPQVQEYACKVLINLAYCSTGVTKAIESGGIKVILAAINNHLGSAEVCGYACWALFNIVFDNKENTELLISLGGEAAVSKVKTKWPDLEEVHLEALLDLIVQMTVSQPTKESSCKSLEVVIASPKVPAVSFLPTATKVANGSLKVTALSFQPTLAEDTTASPPVPTLSSQSTLIGIYHEPSDGASPSPKVTAVPSTLRSDSQLKPEATPEVVSQQPRNDRKYKATESSEAIFLESTDEGERNATKVVTRSSSRGLRERKFHNVHTDASTLPVASREINAQVLTEKDSTAASVVSTSNTEQEECTSNAEPQDQIQNIGMLIQDLFYSDNTTFNAALRALLFCNLLFFFLHVLRVYLLEDSRKWDHVISVGGCFAVVPIMWPVVKEMLRWIS